MSLFLNLCVGWQNIGGGGIAPHASPPYSYGHVNYVNIFKIKNKVNQSICLDRWQRKRNKYERWILYWISQNKHSPRGNIGINNNTIYEKGATNIIFIV